MGDIGGDLGVILGMIISSLLMLCCYCCYQDDLQDDPQDDPADLSRVAECTNKVLAKIEYMSGLCDSNLIVEKVVVMGKQHQGGDPFINPRWR